jgi:hypothetical protein
MVGVWDIYDKWDEKSSIDHVCIEGCFCIYYDS